MDENEGIIGRIVIFLKSPFALFTYKKLAFAIFTLVLVLTGIFAVSHAMPETPADIMAAKSNFKGGITAIGGSGGTGGGGGTKMDVIRSIYAKKFGLGESIQEKFKDFWRRMITFDFGPSFKKYPTPVSELIANSLPWTMALIIPVIPVGFVVGNWIGSRAAFYGGKSSNTLFNIMVYLARAPYYWLALLLALVFAHWLELLPYNGAYDTSKFLGPTLSLEFFLSALKHWLLPFISLLGLGMAPWAIGMRSMMVYEQESDYLVFMKQLGFKDESRRKAAQNNAILPNFTRIPITLKNLVGTTLIVEIVFGYPGLGQLTYSAAFARDYPLLQATFLVSIIIVVFGNFLTDIIYGKLDPRIGTSYVQG